MLRITDAGRKVLGASGVPTRCPRGQMQQPARLEPLGGVEARLGRGLLDPRERVRELVPLNPTCSNTRPPARRGGTKFVRLRSFVSGRLI